MKMMKHMAAVAAIMIAATSFGNLPAVQTSAEEEQIYYYGDLDGDECLTVFDLCLMKRGYGDPETLTELQTAICDLSANGEFDIEDIRLLQDYLLA